MELRSMMVRPRCDNGKRTPFRRYEIRRGSSRSSVNREVYARSLNKIARSNQHNDRDFPLNLLALPLYRAK